MRAQETAQTIAERTGHTVDVTGLVTERIIPTGLVGEPRRSTEVRTVLEEWEKTIFSETERVGTGENFADIKARAKAALQYLQERPEQKLLVVTHGFFLRVLLSYVMFGDALTADEARHVIKFTSTENTGITVLTYGLVERHAVDPGEERWLIRVFNDHAHLG